MAEKSLKRWKRGQRTCFLLLKILFCGSGVEPMKPDTPKHSTLQCTHSNFLAITCPKSVQANELIHQYPSGRGVHFMGKPLLKMFHFIFGPSTPLSLLDIHSE